MKDNEERFKQRVLKLCGPNKLIDDYVNDTFEHVDDEIIRCITNEEIVDDFGIYIRIDKEISE